MIGGLDVNHFIVLAGYKVDFPTARLLAGEDFVLLLREVQIDGILYQLVDVSLHVESHVAIPQAHVFEIVFFANLECLKSVYIHASHLVDKVGVLQESQVVDDLQRGHVYPLRFKVFADVVGREQVPYIVCRVDGQGLQEIDIADSFAFHHILQHDGGIDIPKVFEYDVRFEGQVS